MWLRNGDHAVLVSPQGGSILQWQWREHLILGPTRIVRVGDELKKRGATHWCYPNFGTVKPGIGWKSPQHGFLRNSVLDVALWSDNSARFETLSPSNDERAESGPFVTVAADSRGVQVFLRVMNDGLERVPILPAIHPYFAVPAEGISLIVGNKPIRGEDIPSNDHPTEEMVIERGGLPVWVYLHGIGRVELKTSKDCSHVVVWSDNPSAYVCVEPVFGKPGTYGSEQGRWLDPGETAICNVDFRFAPGLNQ